jgi:hypothetical protein
VRTGEQRKAHAGAEGSAREQNCRRQRAGAEGSARGRRAHGRRAARGSRRQRAGVEGTGGGQRVGAEGSAHGRREHGKRTARGSRRQHAREERTGGRQRAATFHFYAPRARSRWIPTICCRLFFFPMRPECLNRAQGDASTHQATPFSPRSWRQQRSKILHAPTLKRRSGDALRTP